jgi:Xaa-Pro aminopeptidase
MLKPLFSVFLVLLSFFPRLASAGEFQEDLKARRARAMERLRPESMLILWSAPTRVYSRDVDYEYRQDSNLYYLSGIDQEGTILVLMPGNLTRKEILFVKERNPRREHWTGHILSKEEVTAQSGVEKIYLTTEFETFVSDMLSRTPFDLPPYRSSPEYDTFFKALTGGRARLGLILSPKPGLSEPLGPTFEFANRVKERSTGLTIEDATDILRDLRQVKTPYERKVLERSVEISNLAHLAGMKAARPGAYEYEVKAAIEQVYKSSGALGWGYPPIVGSGPNTNILHYEKSNRRMEAGDLLLVDAAANYEYLTGDITRTYPVSGAFSPLQEDIYRIVLAAQEEGMKVAKSGVKLSDIHQKTVQVVKEGLLKLGLISDAAGDQYRTWYTHGACHFIGMDVHDVGDYDRPLEPGMAFVIEPGLYIRDGALEDLPRNPENEAFSQKVRSSFEKYKNIGIRVEDSFLLTESGLKQLSAKVPRTIEEIESFMQAHSKTNADR